jgi:hypothetical protein
MFDARTHRAIWTGVGESTVQRDPARQIADLDLALQKMSRTSAGERAGGAGAVANAREAG